MTWHEAFLTKLPFSANLSVAITLLGILTYYFGRLVNSAKIRRQDRFENQVSGALFTVFFVLIPTSIIFEIQQLRKIAFMDSYFSLLVILGIYSASTQARNYINLKGDTSELTEKIKEKGEELKKKETKEKRIYQKFADDFEQLVEEIVATFDLATEITFNKISIVNKGWIQFIFAILAALPLIGVIQESSMVEGVVISTLYLMTMSVMAISYGFNKADLFEAKIKTINGKSFQGQVIEINRNFIEVYSKGGTKTLIRENIISLEPLNNKTSNS